MIELYTYAALSPVHPAQLNALQDAMMIGSVLQGYRRGGDTRQDSGTGATTIKVAPNNILMNANTVDLGVVTTESSVTGGNTANTWYYPYASAAGAVETLSVSTTAPDAALLYRSNSTAYRYLSCYRADATSILPYYKVGTVYTYRRSQVAAARLRAVSRTTTTTGTYVSVALSGFVPPHVRLVTLRVVLTNNSGALGKTVRIRTTGCTGNYVQISIGISGAAARVMEREFTIECDSAQTVELYYDDGADNAGIADVYVVGFDERSVS